MMIKSKGSTSGSNSRAMTSASRSPGGSGSVPPAIGHNRETVEQGRRLVCIPTSAESLKDRKRVACLVGRRHVVRHVRECGRELEPDPTTHDRPLLCAEDIQRLVEGRHCALPLRAVYRDPPFGETYCRSKHRALGRHRTCIQPLERQLGTVGIVPCQLYLDQQLEQPPCPKSVADEIM